MTVGLPTGPMTSDSISKITLKEQIIEVKAGGDPYLLYPTVPTSQKGLALDIALTDYDNLITAQVDATGRFIRITPNKLETKLPEMKAVRMYIWVKGHEDERALLRIYVNP